MLCTCWTHIFNGKNKLIKFWRAKIVFTSSARNDLFILRIERYALHFCHTQYTYLLNVVVRSLSLALFWCHSSIHEIVPISSQNSNFLIYVCNCLFTFSLLAPPPPKEVGKRAAKSKQQSIDQRLCLSSQHFVPLYVLRSFFIRAKRYFLSFFSYCSFQFIIHI